MDGREVAAAIQEFVERIDALDPSAGASVELHADFRFSAPVARALVEALRSYHDPRDRGQCDHCGGRRLDDNFVCADCGRGSGVFGQLIMERAEQFTPPPELPG